MNLHKIKYEAKEVVKMLKNNETFHLPVLNLGHSEGKEKSSSNRFVRRIEIANM